MAFGNLRGVPQRQPSVNGGNNPMMPDMTNGANGNNLMAQLINSPSANPGARPAGDGQAPGGGNAGIDPRQMFQDVRSFLTGGGGLPDYLTGGAQGGNAGTPTNLGEGLRGIFGNGSNNGAQTPGADALAQRPGGPNLGQNPGLQAMGDIFDMTRRLDLQSGASGM